MKNKNLLRKILTGISVFSLLMGMTIAYQSQAADQNVTYTIEPSVISAKVGEDVEFTIKLQNPHAQHVVSMRAWMKYDPSKFDNIRVERSGNLDLTSPGEDEAGVYNSDNVIKMGFAKAGGTNAKTLDIATVKMKVLSATIETIEMKFYNYPDHTTVKILENGFPANVLQNPDQVKLTLTLNELIQPSQPPTSPSTSGNGAYRELDIEEKFYTDITSPKDEEEEEDKKEDDDEEENKEEDSDVNTDEQVENNIVVSAGDSIVVADGFSIASEKLNSGMYRIEVELENPQADEKFKFFADGGTLDTTQIETNSEGKAFVLYSLPIVNGSYIVRSLWVGHGSAEKEFIVSGVAEPTSPVLSDNFNDTDLVSNNDKPAIPAVVDNIIVDSKSETIIPPVLAKTGPGMSVMVLLPGFFVALGIVRRRK